MKKLHLGSSLVLFSAIAAGAATLTPENAEVVVVKGSPDVVKVAGRELAGFLSRSFGGEVPVSESPTEGRVSVVLGDNALSRAAGFALERLHDRRNRTVVELELGEYAGGSAFALCPSVPSWMKAL